jgi:hypothetical protein
MAVNQLSDGRSDGLVIGRSAIADGTGDKLGFYGLTTPIVQPAHTDQAAITAGATTTACNNAVIQLQLVLKNLNLMKGSN